jgi:hypothetical protein
VIGSCGFEPKGVVIFRDLEINSRVAKLYGLAEDGIAIVEGKELL